jgi:acyl-coenzyme A synthetase/AMP-(fatty) acid ligase
MDETLVGRLLRHARQSPSHEAVATPRLRLTYAELAARVAAQARRLREAGVSRDAVVGIACPDDVQHLVLRLAAAAVGASSCTVPSREGERQQEELIDRCGVTHRLGPEAALQPGDPLPAPAGDPLDGAGDAAVLFLTSGTTGEPKIVRLHGADLVAQAHRHVQSPGERFACLATMEHNFATRHRLYCVAQGATNVFVDAAPEGLVAQCRALAVSVMHLSAFQAQELLAIPGVEALSGIRLKLGGSHVPASLRQQLRRGITPILQAGYGTTETGAIAFTDPDDDDAVASVGRPLPGIEVRVTSPAGDALPGGERGELSIRCPGMFHGYHGREELTAARLKDGWFQTGDIGYLDDQGRIHLCGRSDDMFVFNSVNIHPQDLESQLRQFPAVADAAVLPKRSPVHGDIPVALIVPAGNARPDLHALRVFMRDRVGIRCPRQFIVVDRIPRNAAGKIMRAEAQQMLADHSVA